MRIPIAIVLSILVWQQRSAGAPSAAPDADAIAQYRAYVAAVRAGKIDDAIKLVEPVPESCKPLLNARIKMAIAVEALKKEMIAQMGPPRIEEEGWAIGGLPYDDLLKSLKGVAQGENVTVLVATNPRTKQEGSSGWMVRRSGKWVVPATMVMDLQPPEDPSAPFAVPSEFDLAEDTKYADSTRRAADAVLKRLQSKEFKNPAEVVRAFGDEMKKEKGPR